MIIVYTCFQLKAIFKLDTRFTYHVPHQNSRKPAETISAEKRMKKYTKINGANLSKLKLKLGRRRSMKSHKIKKVGRNKMETKPHSEENSNNKKEKKLKIRAAQWIMKMIQLSVYSWFPLSFHVIITIMIKLNVSNQHSSVGVAPIK